MKKAIIAGVMVLSTGVVKAQTFDEWFKQKATQLQYLAAQISALEAYGKVVNKGYAVAATGLTNIFNSKDGDYRKHHDYFLSLLKVKTPVKNYSKVLSTYKMETDIERLEQLIQSLIAAYPDDQERSYIRLVYSSLVKGCRDLVNELDQIISDDQLALKDDERISRINKVYLEMQDRYQFCRSFVSQIKMLLMNRLKEVREVERLSRLYQLK